MIVLEKDKNGQLRKRLYYLKNNIDVNIIAQTHNRTVGGIIGKQRDVAYKMHINNASMTQILNKTKLNKEQFEETITTQTESNKNKYKKRLEIMNAKMATSPVITAKMDKPLNITSNYKSLENEVITPFLI